MPPTIPIGSPTIGVVFACLLVYGKDYGIRPFVVPLNDVQQMCRGVTARFVNLSSRADQSSIDSMDVDFFPIEICRAPLTTQSPTLRTFDFHLMPFSDPVKNVSILIWNSCNQYGVLESDRSLLEVSVSQHQNFTPPSVHCTACAAWLDMVQNVYRSFTSSQQIPVLTAIAQSYVLEAY